MVIAEHSEFQVCCFHGFLIELMWNVVQANIAVSAIEHLITDVTTSRPPQSILLGAIPLKTLTCPISLGFPEIGPWAKEDCLSYV